ncbi:sucrose synthase 7-like protein [Tanacetum coccineum]
MEESSEEDEDEEAQVLEGLLRYMLCTTQEATIVPPYVSFAIIPIGLNLFSRKSKRIDLTVYTGLCGKKRYDLDPYKSL